MCMFVYVSARTCTNLTIPGGRVVDGMSGKTLHAGETSRVVRVECDTGYMLGGGGGRANLTCLENGTWPDAPTCTGKFTGGLPVQVSLYRGPTCTGKSTGGLPVQVSLYRGPTCTGKSTGGPPVQVSLQGSHLYR